ncbi:hypothetical protein COPCOM_02662 [Coprococcus comes ATCC 27758]|uniref:Uncharacterized protein n=2 Tax=Coprococcus comes TaxID=410072 RepID=C0BA35_9FIRM|nr:hypothetical protein COPCOM_02662 [Coprococcus comes ATCC 27758]
MKIKHIYNIIEKRDQEVETMPEYTEKQKEQRRKAVADFMKTVDRVNCQLPLGTKERIKELTGKSCNAFIKEVVVKELDKIERKRAKEN